MQHLIAIIAGLGVAAGSGALLAQQQPPQPPQPGMQQTQVSNTDVRKFAEIYVDVEQTRDLLSREMAEAESQQEAQEIQARMQEEIVATIENNGWSVERYNTVANAISSDPQLREQAIALIERVGG